MGVITETDRKMLYSELSEFEKNGINLVVEESPASPLQVVNAYVIRENMAYMRDYELDENGGIKRISFHLVKAK